MSDPDTPQPGTPGRSTTRLAGPPRGSSIHLSRRAKITSIKVIKLTFKTDHHLMTDNNSDWTNSGSLFSKPEWTFGSDSNPISHTRNQSVNMDLDFEVQPANAGETIADVTGTATLETPGSTAPKQKLVFAAAQQKFKGGVVTVSAALNAPWPKLVAQLTGDIQWSVKTKDDGPFDAGASSGHQIFFTMNTPVNAPGREAGITKKRMRRAVALVAEANSDDPHAIAVYLQRKFPSYTLQPNPNVPSQFHHPRYFADVSQGEVESGCGAWPSADYFTEEAECQAIIRFMRAVMMQVGCPGTMSIMVVWADPSNNAKVMEGDWDAGAGGLAGITKVVNGKTWSATLVDKDPVKAGQLFDLGAIGLNNFEACLKLTAGGKTVYYGGGAGDYDTKEDVITAFEALCWVSFVNLTNGDRKIRIEQIVKSY